jgi:hypothetical protein
VCTCRSCARRRWTSGRPRRRRCPCVSCEAPTRDIVCRAVAWCDVCVSCEAPTRDIVCRAVAWCDVCASCEAPTRDIVCRAVAWCDVCVAEHGAMGQQARRRVLAVQCAVFLRDSRGERQVCFVLLVTG